MPRGSKRKFNSDQEPTNVMVPKTSNRRAATYRPKPNPETQELYNRMRQEEERPRLELLQDGVQDGSSGFLRPPSSQASPTSPSPSHASTTYDMSRAMNDLDVGGDQPRAKKPRAGRQGPLSEYKKLRAAFMRKVGACTECSDRKVRCDHFDPEPFEAAYQAAKRAADQPLDSLFQLSDAPPYQPRLGNSLDLFGVSDWPNSTNPPCPHIPSGIHSGRDDSQGDFDPLSEQAWNQQAVVRPHLASVLYAFAGLQPAVSSPGLHYPALNVLPSVPEPIFVPIGKQLAPYGDEWQCLYGSDETGCSTATHALAPCGECHGSLKDLKLHYTSTHGPFSKEQSMWRCTKCDFDYPASTQPCPNCVNPEPFPFSWQRWHWADVSVPPNSSSRPLGRVASQDGSPSNRSSWTNHSAQFSSPTGDHSSSSYTANPFVGYGYGNSAAGQSYRAADTAPQKHAQQSKASCCEKLTLTKARNHADCFRNRIWHLTSRPTRSSEQMAIRAALFRHSVCPPAVLLTLLVLLAFVDIVLSTDHRFDGVLGQGYPPPVVKAVWQPLRIPELSVACIIAGSIASWLFRHVNRSRVDRHGLGGLHAEGGGGFETLAG